MAIKTEPLPAMVFQCLSCSTILGDSLEFVCSVEELQLIALRGALLVHSPLGSPGCARGGRLPQAPESQERPQASARRLPASCSDAAPPA